jgi:hypothetical protein
MTLKEKVETYVTQLKTRYDVLGYDATKRIVTADHLSNLLKENRDEIYKIMQTIEILKARPTVHHFNCFEII